MNGKTYTYELQINYIWKVKVMLLNSDINIQMIH